MLQCSVAVSASAGTLSLLELACGSKHGVERPHDACLFRTEDIANTMPGIVMFGRRWSVGSDDMVVAAVFLAILHLVW